MNRHLINILIILSLFYISGCGSEKSKTDYSIYGNWSTLIDSVYNEVYFGEDTLETFNFEWDFLPPSLYKLVNDSITIKSTLENSTIIKYKITFLDSNNAVLDNLNTKFILEKIPDNQYTIDDLIKQGYFNFGFDNPTSDSLRANFIENVFRIREVNYLTEKDILNKDTLIRLWNSQIINDSTNQEYYKFLLKKLK
jgi:hypothetical protein